MQGNYVVKKMYAIESDRHDRNTHTQNKMVRDFFIFCVQCLSDHMFTLTALVYYSRNETLGTAAEIDCWCACVSSYICQLGGIIHQSESSCLLCVSIGLVIGFCLNLAKQLPLRRRESHFVCTFSLSAGDVMDRRVCVS